MEQLTFLNCLIYGEFSFFSEVVYVTTGNPALCLALYLAGVAACSTLATSVSKKIKFWLIRTRELGSVRLPEELYII